MNEETKETKTDRLDRWVRGWREMRYDNGQPKFAEDGTMLDERGNRSIFDDIDE